MRQMGSGPDAAQVEAAIQRFEAVQFPAEDKVDGVQAAMAARFRDAGCYVLGVAGVETEIGVVMEDDNGMGLFWLERRTATPPGEQWVDAHALIIDPDTENAQLFHLMERDGEEERRIDYTKIVPPPSSYGRLYSSVQAGRRLSGHVRWEQETQRAKLRARVQRLVEHGAINPVLTAAYVQPEALKKRPWVVYPMPEVAGDQAS